MMLGTLCIKLSTATAENMYISMSPTGQMKEWDLAVPIWLFFNLEKGHKCGTVQVVKVKGSALYSHYTDSLGYLPPLFTSVQLPVDLGKQSINICYYKNMARRRWMGRQFSAEKRLPAIVLTLIGSIRNG